MTAGVSTTDSSIFTGIGSSTLFSAFEIETGVNIDITTFSLLVELSSVSLERDLGDETSLLILFFNSFNNLSSIFSFVISEIKLLRLVCLSCVESSNLMSLLICPAMSCNLVANRFKYLLCNLWKNSI